MEAVETARAGLSPQEGDVRKREKKKTKEGEKVARVSSTKNFFFFVHEYLGLEAARLI